MSLLLDCSRIDCLIYYPAPLHTYQNRWKVPLLNIVQTVKNEPVDKISTCVYPPIPLCLVVQQIPLLLLLLHCSLSNTFLGFSPWSPYFFWFNATKHLFSSIHSHFTSAQWLSYVIVGQILGWDCGASTTLYNNIMIEVHKSYCHWKILLYFV